MNSKKMPIRFKASSRQPLHLLIQLEGSLGELLHTLVGLAMISELSPPNLVGMMIGEWFLTQFAAYAIGGGLARVANVVDVSAIQSIGIYSHAFFIYGGMSLILAIASFLLIPYLKGLIGYSKEV